MSLVTYMRGVVSFDGWDGTLTRTDSGGTGRAKRRTTKLNRQ